MSSREQSFSPLRTDWWLMNADGTSKRRLTRFSDPAAPEYTGYTNSTAADCDWSPDGTKVIGYVQETGTTPDSGRLVSVRIS